MWGSEHLTVRIDVLAYVPHAHLCLLTTGSNCDQLVGQDHKRILCCMSLRGCISWLQIEQAGLLPQSRKPIGVCM